MTAPERAPFDERTPATYLPVRKVEAHPAAHVIMNPRLAAHLEKKAKAVVIDTYRRTV